jgi:branched-chain amino acid transport system permease protein
MLINAVVVCGLQIYIGNTGVLSFGHIGFGAVAGYTFAVLAISVDRKSVTISQAPFGLSEVEWSPLAATAAAVVVTGVVALVIGLGLARSEAKTGAVAATVITLAVLFMAHEVAVNWDKLTGGDRAGLSFGIGDTLANRWPVYAALLGGLVAARLFATSRQGRLAKASREDHLAARAMGNNPAVQQMYALLLSVAVVAVGSVLRVYSLGSITPKFFFFEYTLLTLTMLVVGGRNSTTGAMVGVVVITIGDELTRYLAGPDVDILGIIFRPGLSEMFLGVMMLGFMILRPDGLLGDWELDEWFVRRWRRRHPDTPPTGEPEARDLRPGTLSVVDAEVVFGAFRALDGVSVGADTEQVTGIIGPNGAGKTTLLNVVTGLAPMHGGTVRLDDTELTRAPTYRIARAGLVRTFQNLRLFPALTVRENVAVGALSGHRRADGPSIDRILLEAGLWAHRDRRARALDYGNARRLELARAAATAPTFLLLDEPTSGMNESESLAMIEQVRSIARLVGAGVIVVDHDLGFITGICDRIYCLDQGQVVALGTPAEVQANPVVQAAYLGSAAHAAAPS